MRLDRFIQVHMEEILSEWQDFAKTLLPAAGDMSDLALRDHARQILQAIALDIETRQNPEQQIQKSQGLAPDPDAGESAASIHGALRHASNFSLLQLSAEYRALRATVLRLWLPQVDTMSTSAADQMVRFNEAIDQALAESIITFTASADHMRDLFLAILGHDLRAPLSNMSLAGDMLMHTPVTPDSAVRTGTRIRRSARLMVSMVDDLIGYTRTQLGAGMPTLLAPADLREICQGAVSDAAAAHPKSSFKLEAEGDLCGQFDNVRLHQLLTNLMVNAAQHGARGGLVRIEAHGTPEQVQIKVINDGPAIAEASLQTIFSPLIQLQGENDGDRRPHTSLGLGLFVAREIALAHGGSIEVASSEADGTTFSVCLPRAPAPAAAPAPEQCDSVAQPV